MHITTHSRNNNHNHRKTDVFQPPTNPYTTISNRYIDNYGDLEKTRIGLTTLSEVSKLLGGCERAVEDTIKSIRSISEKIVSPHLYAETKTTIKVKKFIRLDELSVSFNAEKNSPYRLLWAKVIIRAAYDYALWKDAKDLRTKKCGEEVRKWLFEDSDLDFGFNNLCFQFNFPKDLIREVASKLTKEDVKKLEFRERNGKISNDITFVEDYDED